MRYLSFSCAFYPSYHTHFLFSQRQSPLQSLHMSVAFVPFCRQLRHPLCHLAVSTSNGYCSLLIFTKLSQSILLTHRLGLRRISTPSFYNETLRLILSNVSLLLMAITDRSIFAVAKLITFMGLKMDGLDLPGSLTISQPTELLQQP
uniref:Uncharacterized protein n=1 Tax=Brassica campestris TaxID=3711 RepID=A0A3P5Z068_BRACM|nr:unnamed protein product [Brassica rapa]